MTLNATKSVIISSSKDRNLPKSIKTLNNEFYVVKNVKYLGVDMRYQSFKTKKDRAAL